MKKLLLIFILTNYSCHNIHPSENEKKNIGVDRTIIHATFNHLESFPYIEDTVKFISSLNQFLKLEVNENTNQKEEVTIYEKVKIYGSDNDYIFIEYDYKAGVGAAFPWKSQMILTTDGKLIKILEGERFEFVEIFENENPFLLLVNGTFKGDIYHTIYKFSSDTLEKVFDGDFLVMNHDLKVYEPNELNFKVQDFNHDGYNDISFYGHIVYIKAQLKSGDWYDIVTNNGESIHYSFDNPFKKIPVEYIFLFDKERGHFIPNQLD